MIGNESTKIPQELYYDQMVLRKPTSYLLVHQVMGIDVWLPWSTYVGLEKKPHCPGVQRPACGNHVSSQLSCLVFFSLQYQCRPAAANMLVRETASIPHLRWTVQK
jgi:hypothetical protein